MSYVYIGKIVNTHGLKGEVRLLSNFKYKSRVFIPSTTIFIGKNKVSETITTYRKHKQFDMICLKGYNDINEVLKYKGERVYVTRDTLNLKEDEYLDADLIGLDVLVDDKVIGKVNKVDKYPSSDIILVKGQTKNYMIPYVKDFIKEINLTKKVIIINNIKGLIE